MIFRRLFRAILFSESSSEMLEDSEYSSDCKIWSGPTCIPSNFLILGDLFRVDRRSGVLEGFEGLDFDFDFFSKTK